MTSNSPPAQDLPKIPSITAGLRPFGLPAGASGTEAVSALLVTFLARPDGVRFDFALEGHIAALRVPEPDAPVLDPLWQHTCFEVFLSVPGEEGYREFNFSPAGHWAASAFQRYRLREADRRLEEEGLPTLTSARSESLLRLTVDLPATLLPAGPVLRIGLAAVVEYPDGHLDYWAVHHPADKPDFHHVDGWTLQLDTRAPAPA